MPYKSRWSIPIPECSLPTFLFTSASHREPTELANKAAYIDAANPDTHFFTRSSFKLWSQRFGLGMTRMPGFKPGDRVLIFSANSMAIPVAFMGVLMAAGVFTAANPAFTVRELAHQLSNSEAAYLLVAESSLDTAIAAAKTSGLPIDRVRYFDADCFFEKTQKGSLNGVKYWGDIFAGENEAGGYQWPELKGTCACSANVRSCLCL